MTMRKILILIFCLFAAPLWAGPTDALLDKLAIAKTKSDADTIVRSIWIEWLGAYDTDRERQLMDKGIGAMDKKRFKQAEAIFTSILKSNPDFTEAWNKRATVRFLQGDFIGSEADIYEVLIREPRHFGAISGLGLINMHLNEPEKALNSFKLLKVIHPFSEDATLFIPMLEDSLGVRDL
jgi:tetratricopeptide (TPR) repeat protein